jgi:ATP-dependent RNA helicase RhlE
MTFEELGLSQPLLRAVVSAGYTNPTPIQAAAIRDLIAGRDLLGCAQTGTGKTAAFALPILHRLTHAGNPPRGSGRRIRVLVLAPTRELASQIGESFAAYGRHTPLRHVVVYGGVGQGPQVRALRHGVDILVATPGRLVDLMNQGHIDLNSVGIFVLDEADRMLDMGFLPDLRRITARLPKRRQTVLFAATMPPAIERLADDLLDEPVHVRIAPVQATTELIEQSVCFIPQREKPRLLAQFLSTKPIARAIVFTRTKHGADRVARELNRSGIRADAMHGNKSQTARQRTLASFKSSRPPVLVATDVAARGIDVDGVSHVFNFDLPHEAETYVHRIGRTGRAGASGIAISFCDHGERAYLKSIERLIRTAITVDRDHSVERSGAPSSPAEGPSKPAGKSQRRHPGHWNPSRKSSRPKRFFGRPKTKARAAISSSLDRA